VTVVLTVTGTSPTSSPSVQDEGYLLYVGGVGDGGSGGGGGGGTDVGGGASSYDTAVMTDTPLIYLKLDETSGTTASDSSGNAHHFTYGSGVTLNAGTNLLGKMVAGSGSDYIASLLSMPGTFAGTGDWAIEAWVKLPDYSQSGPFVKIGGYGDGFSLGVGDTTQDDSGNHLIGLGEFAGWHNGYHSIGLTDHYVVLDHHSSTWDFYVDGTLAWSDTASAYDATVRIDIGGDIESSRLLTGGTLISHVAIYDAALGATRVAVHFAAALGMSAPMALFGVSTLSAAAHSPTTLHLPTTGAIEIDYHPAPAGIVRQPVLISNTPMSVQVVLTGMGKVIAAPEIIPSGMDLRVAAGVTVTPTVPAFVRGKPLIPDLWVATSSSVTDSGITVVPDPDPIIAGNPHPGGVTPTHAWHVSDLSLGHLTDWAPHGGSGPHWTTSDGFSPRVIQTVVYGTADRYHTYTKGVHFDGADVHHMNLDWGSSLAQPFTVILCGIIHYYPTTTYGHFLLDAGRPVSDSLADGRDHVVSDGLSYRSLMLYRRNTAVLATHTGADPVRSGKHVTARADFYPRPRMFFGIFNGASSYIGAWDNRNQYIKKGTVDSHTHRYFVTGRRQNHVSDEQASHMTLFEIRMYDTALTRVTLKEIYKQLAATWKFNKYHV